MTNPVLLARQFDIVREDLHRRYDALHPAEHVDKVFDEIIAERTATAKITTFLPVTVERAAAELLEAQAEALGYKSAPRREVLYVDERNAGRSQLASAITGHLAGDELFGWAQDTITESQTEDIFNKPQVLEMLKEHRDGVADHSRRLWTVLCFMVWHGIFVEKRIDPKIEQKDYPVDL